MAIPFYDRVSPRCGMCRRRKHVDNFRKWWNGRSVLRPFCTGCEPGEAPARAEAQSQPTPAPTSYRKRKGWDAVLAALYGAQGWCQQVAHADSAAWVAFLDAYREALEAALQRAESMREWGNDPQTADYFFSPERLRLLKELYEAADPKGEHPHGKPACISWFYWKGLE